MEYFIFIPIMSWVIIEAAYYATFGDRHRVSVVVFHILFCLLLAAALPFTNWWQGIAAFIATRIWFDYLYNAFAGLRWSYVGTTAKTDLMIRWLENKFGAILITYLLLIVRLLIFVASIMVI